MRTLTRTQKLPVRIEDAWDFFSCPGNLKLITPPYMDFDITSGYSGEGMYAGMIITYRVRPFLHIPLNWVTEITHVSDQKFFVDDQKAGPFKIWHHRHFFKQIANGVEMTDTVVYDVGYGWAGLLLEQLLVKHRVNEIFDFRSKKLQELFGNYEA
jgi:ligand-binding SRPBCC domain-containing protein